jgi:hypothetical protein
MKKGLTHAVRIVRREERGYTLLEYVAGAAIIGGIVFTALTSFGNDMAGFLGNLGSWAQARGSELAQ